MRRYRWADDRTLDVGVREGEPFPDEFDFTDFSETEMSLEGVTFYSTEPASADYVFTSAGQTVRKTASAGTEASATVGPRVS